MLEFQLMFLFVFLFFKAQAQYTANWSSLDSRPLPTWYDEAKFGIFCHWGVYSVPAYGAAEWFWNSWGDPNTKKFMGTHFPPNTTYADFASYFTAIDFDPVGFANSIKSSGAKYFVITSKHHEGFTLWPNAESWNWNAMDAGPARDLLGEIRSGFLQVGGVRFGTYFSHFAWFHPIYLADQKNNTTIYVDEISRPQIIDLVTNYQPDILWLDGDWLNSYKYWQAEDIVAWLYNESPVKDTIVTNDRWGMDANCVHGGFYTCHDGYNPGQLQSHKWENAFSLTPGWGFRRDINIGNYQSLRQIIVNLVSSWAAGGNVLMNIAPDHNGRLLPIYEERLRDTGLFVNAHSEAIFASKPWIYLKDNSDTWYTSQLRNTTGFDPYRFFNPQTQANTIIYAFVTNWPTNNSVTLANVKPTAQTTVKLFSTNGQFIQLNYTTAVGGGVETSIAGVSVPLFAPNSINAGTFVLKIEYAADDPFTPVAVQSTCQTCQIIMANAVIYYAAGSTQADLTAKLIADCATNIFPTTEDKTSCQNIVNTNIANVFTNELSKNKNGGEICDDIKICRPA